MPVPHLLVAFNTPLFHALRVTCILLICHLSFWNIGRTRSPAAAVQAHVRHVALAAVAGAAHAAVLAGVRRKDLRAHAHDWQRDSDRRWRRWVRAADSPPLPWVPQCRWIVCLSLHTRFDNPALAALRYPDSTIHVSFGCPRFTLPRHTVVRLWHCWPSIWLLLLSALSRDLPSSPGKRTLWGAQLPVHTVSALAGLAAALPPTLRPSARRLAVEGPLRPALPLLPVPRMPRRRQRSAS